ncbi:FAD-dependent oxidoreductase [Gulosibacter sp. ACHW.36C]|uniref:FAD-dependent oxidoreductase n=1 Tax=Gulosibacter sediminis TaxID=1729695 RepID=A0ABY4MZ74_9MICO|nr:FAD-dependent oxidoreductase [Gulosibacter sediminis]UQN15699.1 FAD-dependent oxidoreductase [Gulosibacter sediminis]
MQTSKWDVIIIGAGPAGLAAAQMLGRSRRRTLVLDSGSGRNRFAEHMHGVVGFDGAEPAELRARGRDEAAAYGVEFRAAEVTTVRDRGDALEVVTGAGVEVTRSLVVATGLTDVLPDVPGLRERWGVSVLHGPYCHGYEVRDQRLGVLVTSEAALHPAQLVRQLSDRMTVFVGGARNAEGELVVPAVTVPDEVAQRLRARGVEVVADAAVVAFSGEGLGLEQVRLDDGRSFDIDAVFAAGAFVPHDAMVAGLELVRDETPFGSVIKVDQTGQTSNPRVWATGNVVTPMANVPISLGSGTMTGSIVNWFLVEEDADRAIAAEFWEAKYGGEDRVWSGRVNRVLEDVVAPLPVGRALDLGCGEGADVLWLAAGGWDATGIDLSSSAVARAQTVAADAGVSGATFVAADVVDALAQLSGQEFDLVTASFFQSPVAFKRAAALRTAAARIRPGGRLLLTSHAAPPAWAAEHADAGAGHGPGRFIQPADELAALDLDGAEWEVELAELRQREITAPDGTPSTIDDSVVLLRRVGVDRG